MVGLSGMRKVLPVVVVMSLCGSVLYAQDAREMVQRAVDTEIAADNADHSLWTFHEVDTKPGNSVTQWVAQTTQGSLNRVIERNGQAIPMSQQWKAVESFIHDPGAQQNQRQASQKDDQQAASLLKMLPQAFIWTIASKTCDTTTFHFTPNPNFNPPTRQARVFAAMEGDLTVDNAQQRIMRLKGTMIHDVNFGWGLLGSLKAGGWFEVDREQTAPGIWQIAVMHTHIQGRALLFKTISVQEDDIKTAFERLPDNTTLEEAVGPLMKK